MNLNDRIVKCARHSHHRWRYKKKQFLYSLIVKVIVFGLSPCFQQARSVSYWQRVRNAMQKNFDAYWQSCAGHDEYEPLTSRCDDWLETGLTALD